MPQGAKEDISKDIATGITITCLILAASMYLPIIGSFIAILIPLPTLFFRSKLGRMPGMIIPVLTIIILIVLTGSVSFNVIFFVELLLLGFVLSELFALNLSIEKTIIYACSVVLLSGIIFLLFLSNISGIGIIALISEYVAKNLELTMALYKNIGMPDDNIRLISDSLEQIQNVLVGIIPALTIVSSLIVIWINLLIIKPILKSKNLLYPEFGRLNQWKTPDLLVWVAIGCGVLLLLPNQTLKLIGLNGILVMMPIYFFQGIAVVSFYFEAKRFPRTLKILLYGIIFLQQIILLIVIGLGFFDMWLDFRKYGKPPPAESS